MPRNLSAWVDLMTHLLIMLVLIGLLSYYNQYIATIAGAWYWRWRHLPVSVVRTGHVI